MQTLNETGDRNGVEYRILILRGKYHAALDCDCLLGPHWHDLGAFGRKSDAYKAIDAAGSDDKVHL